MFSTVLKNPMRKVVPFGHIQNTKGAIPAATFSNSGFASTGVRNQLTKVLNKTTISSPIAISLITETADRSARNEALTINLIDFRADYGNPATGKALLVLYMRGHAYKNAQDS